MTEKLDRLGRKIPVFDRVAAGKKSAIAIKEKYGDDYFREFGASGGRVRGRGYFGKLKDEGKIAELKAISSQAYESKRAKSTKSQKTSIPKGAS